MHAFLLPFEFFIFFQKHKNSCDAPFYPSFIHQSTIRHFGQITAEDQEVVLLSSLYRFSLRKKQKYPKYQGVPLKVYWYFQATPILAVLRLLFLSGDYVSKYGFFLI